MLVWEAFYNLVERLATWPVVALLFIFFIVCAQGFEWRRKAFGYENPALDGRIWYSPEETRDFLENIGQRGRRIYAFTELTLDILFPIVYGGLFAILLIHVYARENAKNLMVVPFLTVAADVLENLMAAYLAWQFDGRSSSLARVAAILTAMKSSFFVFSVILVFVGAVAAIWRTFRVST